MSYRCSRCGKHSEATINGECAGCFTKSGNKVIEHVNSHFAALSKQILAVTKQLATAKMDTIGIGITLINCHFGGEGFAILRKTTPDRCAAMKRFNNRRIFTTNWITDAVIPLKPTFNPEFCKVRHNRPPMYGTAESMTILYALVNHPN